VPPGGEAGSGYGPSSYQQIACSDDGTCVLGDTYIEDGESRWMVVIGARLP
jgi:hypothetical protein